jgi:2-methylisocitrate lyase-like PEP mutase family enzyme
MNNWKTALLNTGGRRNGRKGNNRGMMWASLLGLGVSAAVYGLRRNRNMMRPVQNAMNNIRTRTAGSMPNVAAATEFAKELVPNTNFTKNK